MRIINVEEKVIGIIGVGVSVVVDDLYVKNKLSELKSVIIVYNRASLQYILSVLTWRNPIIIDHYHG